MISFLTSYNLVASSRQYTISLNKKKAGDVVKANPFARTVKVKNAVLTHS